MVSGRPATPERMLLAVSVGDQDANAAANESLQREPEHRSRGPRTERGRGPKGERPENTD